MKKNLGFKNLLAEICHFNTPKYIIRTSLAKKNQPVLICGVRLHYDKHFDQKSGFNKGNLYFSTENIM